MADIKRLRVESNDGSPAKEYRVIDDRIEVRSLPAPHTHDGSDQASWWRLTPDQISIHVERNTVLAQWLEQRLGWRKLLRACVGEEFWAPKNQESHFSSTQ